MFTFLQAEDVAIPAILVPVIMTAVVSWARIIYRTRDNIYRRRICRSRHNIYWRRDIYRLGIHRSWNIYRTRFMHNADITSTESH